jgi:hypothetical protein
MIKNLALLTFGLLNCTLLLAQNPQLSSLDPADDATDVALDSDLSITFDESVEINTSLPGGNVPVIRLRRLDNDVVIQTWTPSTSTSGLSIVGGNTLTINPTDDLSGGVSYYVEIFWKVIQDLEGNYYDGFTGNTTWNFTAIVPDVAAPLATSTSPSDEGTYAPLNASGGIVFNESVQEGSGTIALYLANGTLVESITTGVSDSRLGQPATFRITWDFDTQLEELTDYYILVSSGAYEDLAGNAFAGLGVGDLDFTSNDKPNISTLSPTDAVTDVEKSASITVTFDGEIYAADPCSLIIKEYDTDNVFESFNLYTLDLGDGAGSFSDGVITVDPTSDFDYETKYYVTIEPSQSIRYSFNAEGSTELTTKGDWTFTTKAPDTTAPTLTSAGTLDDGTNESAILDFTLTFSEDVTISTAFNMFKLGYSNGGTINFSTYITGTTSNSVSFEYKYLTQGSNLYILIDPSAVTDLAGNAYSGITTSDVLPFTASWTEPEVTTYSPAKSETQVSVSSDLILTFDQNIAFTAETGARIYLKTSSPITTVESFEITSDRITIQSGNQLVIDPTDDLDFNTRYFVTISPHSVTTYGDAGKTFAGYNSTLSWPFTSEFNYWNGTQWADGTPGSTDNVTFKADYGFTADEVLEFNGVYIPAGVSFTIENNATLIHNSYLTNYGDVIIESGSALNSQSNFLAQTGSSLTVKRNTTGGIGDGEYSFIGSPFNGYDFTSITGNYKYQYNQTNNTYTDASGVTTMIPGRGYTIANNDVLEFTGTSPYTGDVLIGVQNSGEGFGYNLVSNPYTAAISYSELIAAEGPDGTGNITATIYLWDDGGAGTKSHSDFITVSALGSVSGGSGRSGDFNGSIGVAQGFFVESTQTNEDLTFTNAMKVSGNNSDVSFFRIAKDTYETVKLVLENDAEERSEILLGWVADAKAGYDTRYDSRKLVGNSLSQLYMPIENKELAIQGVPLDYQEAVALALDIKEAGNYRIAIAENMTSRKVLLHDKQEGVIHDLKEGAYSFHSAAGVYTKRFEILSPTEVLSAELYRGQIYAHEKVLHIKSTNDEEYVITIYSLRGQQMIQRTAAGSQQIDLSGFQSGVYIVIKGVQSQKIILK